MNLRKVAATFETTQFETYDEALETWDFCPLVGKVMPIDRFLSNFNRPTKRRLLGISPDAEIPDSRTIRVPSTGEIYFIGELRTDAQQGAAYDQVGVLHRSVATAVINRKAPVGPSNDPGWLVSAEIGKHYGDTELRATAEIEENRQEFEGDYFVMFPPQASLERWDEVVFQGDNYMIQTSYPDSGFRFARAVRRSDPRTDFVYHARSITSGYNTATGQVFDGLVNYNVTGLAFGDNVSELNYAALKAGELKVVVEQDHIGIVPKTEDELTWDGQLYKVFRVSQDFQHNQYELHCTL
jgi:hypothetical protein